MSVLYICEKKKEQAFHYKKLEVIWTTTRKDMKSQSSSIFDFSSLTSTKNLHLLEKLTFWDIPDGFYGFLAYLYLSCGSLTALITSFWLYTECSAGLSGFKIIHFGALLILFFGFLAYSLPIVWEFDRPYNLFLTLLNVPQVCFYASIWLAMKNWTWKPGKNLINDRFWKDFSQWVRAIRKLNWEGDGGDPAGQKKCLGLSDSNFSLQIRVDLVTGTKQFFYKQPYGDFCFGVHMPRRCQTNGFGDRTNRTQSNAIERLKFDCRTQSNLNRTAKF